MASLKTTPAPWDDSEKNKGALPPCVPWPLDPQARHLWQKRLHHWLAACQDLSAKAKHDLLDTAAQICDWPMALRLFERYAELRQLRPTGYAYACWKSGYWIQSWHFLEQQMLKAPTDADLFAMYNHLLDMSDQQGLARYQNANISQRIALEPLQPHHCDDYLWQSWDPVIAEDCCLPHFKTASEWHHWFKQQCCFEDQTLFAIQHHRWGFVGVVSLVVHSGTGFFYFWLGRDFRGCGIGTEAGMLLLDFARESLELKACFAKVFSNNLRSVRTLQKIGFVPLPYCGLYHHRKEQYFYYGHTAPQEIVGKKLMILFEKMQAPLSADLPFSWKVLA